MILKLKLLSLQSSKIRVVLCFLRNKNSYWSQFTLDKYNSYDDDVCVCACARVCV